MKQDKIYPEILSAFIITRVTDNLAKELGLTPEQKSVGIVTATVDDLVFIGMDEATKKANVQVVYAKSFYGGNANASSKLQGEGIGMIAGPDVSEVRAGMDAIMAFSESHNLYVVSCNDDDSICYLTYTISSVGSYFSKELEVPEGSSIAYLVGPPVETVYASDVALKASNAKLVKFYGPPTETNCGGAMLNGTQSDCVAACGAFARAVQEVADNPIYNFGGSYGY